jgi:hypothetical protein
VSAGGVRFGYLAISDSGTRKSCVRSYLDGNGDVVERFRSRTHPLNLARVR